MRMSLITTLVVLVVHGQNSGALTPQNLENVSKQGGGCTAPFLLPFKPFVVVWNHPSHICKKHGIDIDFEKWGIVDNKNDNFIGEKISLLYRPGKWPYYIQNVPYNGGIPQLGNESVHIQSFKDVLDTEVSDENFSGLGVIDFEKWRPLFSLNFDNLKIYKKKSKELARQRHPSFNKTDIFKEAVDEFEKAARSYIENTLKTATALRPLGQWGYYGYPRCWDANCNASTVTTNDRMSWVFGASTGLFPSIYFHSSTPPASHYSKVKKTLLETLRVKAKWAPTDAAIFPYALMQDGPFSFFTPADLEYAIRQPADMGSSGVLLWGSSATASAKNECRILQDYVNTTLGPFSKHVMEFFSNCSIQKCSAHGRCVRKDYEVVYQRHLQLSGREHCRIPWRRLRRTHREHASQVRASYIHKRLHKREIFQGVHNKWGLHKIMYRVTGEKNWPNPRRHQRLSKKRNDFKQEILIFRQDNSERNLNKEVFINWYMQQRNVAKLERLFQTMQPKGETVGWRISEQTREKDRGSNDGLNKYSRESHSWSQRSPKRKQLKHQNHFVHFNRKQNVKAKERDSLLFLQEKTSEKPCRYARTHTYKDFNLLHKVTPKQDRSSIEGADFEDYVCKCFDGWSGQHCHVKPTL